MLKKYSIFASLAFLFFIPILFLAGCKNSFHADVKKMKVGDIELAYYTRGSGEPLVMIMGFRGTMAIWDPDLLEELAKHNKLIIFDNRGVGLSSDSEKNQTTIPQMAEDTVGLIKALGYQKAHVLGWSMGSRIAMTIAINHPEIVESLILCSPNPGGRYQVRRTSDAYEKLMSLKIISNEKALSLIFPDTAEGHAAEANFAARLALGVSSGAIPNDFKVSNETIARQVHALDLWDQDDSIFHALQDIKIPTLAAGGLSDALDRPENVHIIASQIPLSWSVYFPGAGHAFLSQDHQQASEIIGIFLASYKMKSNEH